MPIAPPAAARGAARISAAFVVPSAAPRRADAASTSGSM
jgi:hypothetical protein